MSPYYPIIWLGHHLAFLFSLLFNTHININIPHFHQPSQFWRFWYLILLYFVFLLMFALVLCLLYDLCWQCEIVTTSVLTMATNLFWERYENEMRKVWEWCGKWATNFLHGKVGDFFLMLDGLEHHCYLSIIFWSTTIFSNSRTVTSSMLILVSCMISIYQIVDCGCKNNLMIHTHHLTIIIAPIPMISSHLTGKTNQPAPTPLFIPD